MQRIVPDPTQWRTTEGFEPWQDKFLVRSDSDAGDTLGLESCCETHCRIGMSQLLIGDTAYSMRAASWSD